MTQEHKDMLIRDLSARLPYHVKVEIDLQSNIYPPMTCEVCNIEIAETGSSGSFIGVWVLPDSYCEYREFLCKPYLFPLSSMTEEQEKELITITDGTFRYRWGDITNAIPRKNTSEWGISENAFINSIKVINILYIWLLKNHFDINGLIPLGLAKDATGLGIY